MGIFSRQFIVAGLCASKCRSSSCVVTTTDLGSCHRNTYLVTIHHASGRGGKSMTGAVIGERCCFAPSKTNFLLFNGQRTSMIGNVVIRTCQSAGGNGIVSHVTILFIVVCVFKCTFKHSYCFAIHKAFTSYTIIRRGITIRDCVVIGGNSQVFFVDSKSGRTIDNQVVIRYIFDVNGSCTCIGIVAVSYVIFTISDRRFTIRHTGDTYCLCGTIISQGGFCQSNSCIWHNLYT